MSFYAAYTVMSTATHELRSYTFACYLIRWIGGVHHFLEGCLIERTYYEQLIREARDVTQKHEISARLNLEFENLVKLYECYFEFKSRGGEVVVFTR